MPKSSTLNLVDVLSGGQADALLAGGYYDSVMLELSRDGWFVDASLAAPVAGTGVYTFPDDVVQIFSYFYDAQQLSLARLKELNQVNKDWRDEKGTPQAVVLDGESTKTFRLYPIPDVNPSTYAFAFGEDLGRGYPNHTVLLIHGDQRVDCPSFLELPIALMVLEREMDRDSAHRDPTFAKMAGDLGRMILQLLKPT